MIKRLLSLPALALSVMAMAAPVQADKLDDVIDNGVLRCGVVLDFPPIGFRDENNEPAGFDVEYCKDLAKVLEVDYKLVPLTWSERLPSIVTNRTDVVFGSTSDTLERGKTVGFSIPYVLYYSQAVVAEGSGVKSFEDLKGKRVASALGTMQEQHYLKYAKKWGVEHLYQGYQSENEVFLAVAQGKADVGITSNTTVGPIVKQYDNIEPGPRMPWETDYTSAIGPRKDQSWLNYLNLFITHQVRSGRYDELWGKYVGGDAPELRIPGVYY
ncbi:transporter substrate-binding domain-containing protein [Parendozoicomonas haliclonae]|uniref:Cystine-binding periplasmic protein n=1 Tax=Parendozoicomonas haliclonae TaxID=1960125 RepID=A0A1X7AIU4_9GAMM|nr:transporter substrate-binding domain-containing protein [Parendozoicomonas haliclonae]SMA44323.1 Cystine-binding periplasmic protein precursor [Parendozoicomonas haliclonae]